MRPHQSLINRAVLAWFGALLLMLCLPRTARADALYSDADFDRDGQADIVRIQNAPSARGLVVWLSRSKTLHLLRTRLPIHRVAVADIDGDGRVDLVAADSSAKLHVWRRSSRGHLTPIRPRRCKPTAAPFRRGGVRQSPDTAPVTASGTTIDPPVVPSRLHIPFVPNCSLLRRSSTARPAAIALGPRQPRAPPAVD